MKLKIAIATLLAIPALASAEEQQLPTIIVEGVYQRPGTFPTAPDSSVLKDTASLLERVPGATVNRNGPLTGIASYHGMYGNRINVNIDGMDIKEVGPNSMDPPLSHIPAPLVKSLKVQRGVAPVSSGIETIGGSMSVDMRKGRFAEEEGEIEVSGLASMGFSSAQEGKFGVLMGAVANKNHKVYLSGIEEKGHDYKVEDDERLKSRQSTQYDRDSFSTGYAYRRDGHEAELNYNNIDTGISGTPALPMDIMYVRGGLYNGKYQWDLGDGRQLRIEGFYQKMRHLMNNYTLRTSATQKSNRTTVEAGGYKLAWDMPLFDGDLSLGFDADKSLNNANVAIAAMGGINIHFFNDTQRDRYSAFAEWSKDLTEDLSMEVGVRYTHIWSNTGNAIVNMGPKVADANAFNALDHRRNFDFVDFDAIFRYALSDQLDIEVGLGRKNRAPSYQALYLWTDASSVGGLADGNTYLGNLNLKHETAYQFDLGLDWHTDKAYVSPRVYYHYIEDYIQGLKTARALAKGANILEFSNVDAHLFGVDLEAGYSIDENWRLDAGLNYTRGQILSSPVALSNDNLYRIAPLNGRTQVTYQNNGWMGSVEGVFFARQGDVAAYNDELKTAGYMLMNVRASYEPIKNLVIGTGVENILDKRYQNHLGGYQLHNRNNGRVFMPGRNVYATLSYSW